LDSQGPAEGDHVQSAIAETATGKTISGTFQPLHEPITKISPVLGKRKVAALLPAVAATGPFQMATDTPDELEVSSIAVMTYQNKANVLQLFIAAASAPIRDSTGTQQDLWTMV
jgi:hypothetical protein